MWNAWVNCSYKFTLFGSITLACTHIHIHIRSIVSTWHACVYHIILFQLNKNAAIKYSPLRFNKVRILCHWRFVCVMRSFRNWVYYIYTLYAYACPALPSEHKCSHFKNLPTNERGFILHIATVKVIRLNFPIGFFELNLLKRENLNSETVALVSMHNKIQRRNSIVVITMLAFGRQIFMVVLAKSHI